MVAFDSEGGLWISSTTAQRAGWGTMAVGTICDWTGLDILPTNVAFAGDDLAVPARRS
jgi:hypothetical protein